jgi:hypothetical protein
MVCIPASKPVFFDSFVVSRAVELSAGLEFSRELWGTDFNRKEA